LFVLHCHQVHFGELFFGESVSRQLTLLNNGPTEACFDLSFGSVADLKALLATGPDEEASTPDDRLAAFLQVAQIRVSSSRCMATHQPAVLSQTEAAGTCVAQDIATVPAACASRLQELLQQDMLQSSTA
jgi:hypothetical protein